jgi:hypothetical protein
LEKEVLPPAEEREAYAALVKERADEAARLKAEGRASAKERGLFSRLAALVGGLLSGAV